MLLSSIELSKNGLAKLLNLTIQNEMFNVIPWKFAYLCTKKKEQPPNRSDRDIFNIFKHLFLHKYILFHTQVTTLKKKYYHILLINI